MRSPLWRRRDVYFAPSEGTADARPPDCPQGRSVSNASPRRECISGEAPGTPPDYLPMLDHASSASLGPAKSAGGSFCFRHNSCGHTDHFEGDRLSKSWLLPQAPTTEHLRPHPEIVAGKFRCRCVLRAKRQEAVFNARVSSKSSRPTDRCFCPSPSPPQSSFDSELRRRSWRVPFRLPTR